MIQSLTERVKSSLQNSGGDVTTVMCGASLSHHGLLGSLSRMMLCDVNLSQVPDKHLASLASCVTGELTIKNVTGGQQIATLLTNLKCNRLIIYRVLDWERLWPWCREWSPVWSGWSCVER